MRADVLAGAGHESGLRIDLKSAALLLHFILSFRASLMKSMKSLMAGPVLAMWIIVASGHAQTYTFRNVAGAPGPSGGSADGSNGNAQFSFPSGVATDNQGNLYIADQFNYTIRRIIPVGTNWVVLRIRPATRYGSAAEFGRRSSR